MTRESFFKCLHVYVPDQKTICFWCLSRWYVRLKHKATVLGVTVTDIDGHCKSLNQTCSALQWDEFIQSPNVNWILLLLWPTWSLSVIRFVYENRIDTKTKPFPSTDSTDSNRPSWVIGWISITINHRYLSLRRSLLPCYHSSIFPSRKLCKYALNCKFPNVYIIYTYITQRTLCGFVTWSIKCVHKITITTLMYVW